MLSGFPDYKFTSLASMVVDCVSLSKNNLSGSPVTSGLAETWLIERQRRLWRIRQETVDWSAQSINQPSHEKPGSCMTAPGARISIGSPSAALCPACGQWAAYQLGGTREGRYRHTCSTCQILIFLEDSQHPSDWGIANRYWSFGIHRIESTTGACAASPVGRGTSLQSSLLVPDRTFSVH